MIKYLGFICENEYNLDYCDQYENYLDNETQHISDLMAIIKYMQQGVTLFAIAQEDIDIFTKKAISSKIIYTDGIWLWKSYHIHYLKAYQNLHLPSDFLNNIRNNKYQVPQIDESQLKEIVLDYHKKIGDKRNVEILKRHFSKHNLS